ncbi:hypothetical protein [Fredinandcohnia onubensis]|uniref:hypothetical protein n=1 Tax=Fredinandcohnia onubensis TaxID=1571209 RepID=UPI000C0BDF3E|nr:hypothetical protein [Fredinandcohnia onubensis]
MNTNTPMLEDLYNHVRTLTGNLLSSNLDVLKDTKQDELKDSFIKLLNKLALSLLTAERQILAVTGLQGAGKTTIIKGLYDIDDQFLPENISRGEQLPVLITEWDSDNTKGFVHRGIQDANNEMKVEEVELSPSEFKDTSMSPKRNDIWLELKVPFRYLRDESKSIALLPGFEKDPSVRSQELLQHILHLSTSSITVFRKDTYARQSNTDMMNQVQEIYKSVKPIFVLSHGDINPEQNDAMKKNLIKDFGLPETEEDRVVISGNTKIYKEPWKEQLILAINKYAYLTDAAERKRYEQKMQLFKDVQALIVQLEKLLISQEAKSLHRGSGSYQLLARFEREYGKALDKLEETIEDTLNSRVEKAQKDFDIFVQQHESFWKGIYSKFIATELKDQQKLRDELNRIWKEAAPTQPEEQILNIVTNYINEKGSTLLEENSKSEKSLSPSLAIGELSFDDAVDDFLVEDEDEEFELTPLTNNQAQTTKVEQKETSIDRIQNFFSTEEKNQVPVLVKEDLETLTVMGTMLCRQAYIGQSVIKTAIEANQLNATVTQEKLDASISVMEDISTKVEALKSFTPTILKSIPIILGVDVALDGELDTITRTTTALASIGLTITPLQLIGVIGGGLALAYTANAVKKGVRTTNERQLQLSQAGSQVIHQLPKIQSEAFINSLRKIFETMGDRILEQHEKYLGVYEQDGELEKIRYSITKIGLMNRKLREVEFKNAEFIVQS